MNSQKLLDGRTALVTGGTSGIGFYTASALAKMGARVYITGRDLNRGQDAKHQISMAAGHENVHFVQADASTVGATKNWRAAWWKRLTDFTFSLTMSAVCITTVGRLAMVMRQHLR